TRLGDSGADAAADLVLCRDRPRGMATDGRRRADRNVGLGRRRGRGRRFRGGQPLRAPQKLKGVRGSAGVRMNGPDPKNKHPMTGFPQVCFIKNTVNNPNIEIGDYTYYDDPEGSENFERNVLYHFSFVGDRLVIGKFCAIARGVKFIMNGANHKLSGISTYPFQIFGNGWEKVMPKDDDLPYKGDTVVGIDVWCGDASLVMPGVRIGNGAIVAARSVVVANVPAYGVVGGNPAKLIESRVLREDTSALEALAWCDWPVEKITAD